MWLLSWVCLFLACLMSAPSTCNVSGWLQEQPKIAIKAWIALICTKPLACSHCLGVSSDIPVVIICHCGCVTCYIKQILYPSYTCSCNRSQSTCFSLFCIFPPKTKLAVGTYRYLHTPFLYLGYMFYIKFLFFLNLFNFTEVKFLLAFSIII